MVEELGWQILGEIILVLARVIEVFQLEVPGGTCS